MAETIQNALYVVATPIGHLGDLSPRAQHILAGVDVVAAEDTRNTQSLLQHFGISAHTIAVHEHNERNAAEGIIKLIGEGKSVALVSDAGTPAVSDPGARVVAAVHAAGQRVVPIAGPSALIVALSASGEGEAGFLFHGFLPTKAGERSRVLTGLTLSAYALVFYESPHRITESVAAIAEVFGDRRVLTICRELTKKFETIARMPPSAAVAWLEEDDNRQRGEFVLILSKPSNDAAIEPKMAQERELERTLQILIEALPVKQAVAMAVRLTGGKKNAIYEMALRMKAEPSI